MYKHRPVQYGAAPESRLEPVADRSRAQELGWGLRAERTEPSLDTSSALVTPQLCTRQDGYEMEPFAGQCRVTYTVLSCPLLPTSTTFT